jgi:hypothetical protein
VVWWIVGAIVLIGLLFLGFAVLLLLGRVRQLRYLERTLLRRAEQALELQEPVLALQRRAEAMQEQLTELQQRLEVWAARRAET